MASDRLQPMATGGQEGAGDVADSDTKRERRGGDHPSGDGIRMDATHVEKIQTPTEHVEWVETGINTDAGPHHQQEEGL
eukprot:2890004-Rhodomonas_salina.1